MAQDLYLCVRQRYTLTMSAFDQYLNLDHDYCRGYKQGLADGYQEGILFLLARLEDIDKVSDITIYEFCVKMRDILSRNE